MSNREKHVKNQTRSHYQAPVRTYEENDEDTFDAPRNESTDRYGSHLNQNRSGRNARSSYSSGQEYGAYEGRNEFQGPGQDRYAYEPRNSNPANRGPDEMDRDSRTKSETNWNNESPQYTQATRTGRSHQLRGESGNRPFSYGSRAEFDGYSESKFSQPNQYSTHSQFGSDHNMMSGTGNRSLRSHAGKGPKGYKRSDERIKEDICETLERCHWVDASEIDVTVSEGCVCLKGTVESRDEKRMAESSIDDINGIQDIQNDLKVKSQMNKSSAKTKDTKDSGKEAGKGNSSHVL